MLNPLDTFFREKLNTELQSHQEFMHGLLSEQQIHLRQILRFNLNVLPSYETGQQVGFDSRQQMFVTHYKQSEMQYMPVIKDKYFQEEEKKKTVIVIVFIKQVY